MNYRSTAQTEEYQEGQADAIFSDRPNSISPIYLDGLFAQLRERVEAGEDLRFRFVPKETHFAFGYDDNAHIADYQEP